MHTAVCMMEHMTNTESTAPDAVAPHRDAMLVAFDLVKHSQLAGLVFCKALYYWYGVSVRPFYITPDEEAESITTSLTEVEAAMRALQMLDDGHEKVEADLRTNWRAHVAQAGADFDERQSDLREEMCDGEASFTAEEWGSGTLRSACLGMKYRGLAIVEEPGYGLGANVYLTEAGQAWAQS